MAARQASPAKSSTFAKLAIRPMPLARIFGGRFGNPPSPSLFLHFRETDIENTVRDQSGYAAQPLRTDGNAVSVTMVSASDSLNRFPVSHPSNQLPSSVSGPVSAPALSSSAWVNPGLAVHQLRIRTVSNSFSESVLIGAIIASFFGALLLAVLVYFILTCWWRRRRGARSRQPELESGDAKLQKSTTKATARQCYHDSLHDTRTGSGNTAGPKSRDGGFGDPASLNLAPFIPQPADDGTVLSMALAIFDQARLHVENYYPPLAGVSTSINLKKQQGMTSGPERSLMEAYESPFLPGTLAELLTSPFAQVAVISHVLVQTLLSSIGQVDAGSARREPAAAGFVSDPSRSLLPPPFSGPPSSGAGADADKSG